MAVVRFPVRSCVRSPVSGVFGGIASLLNDATSYLGGVEPYHWADYINNRMLYAGADVGTVADGTGYSFTRASEGYYENSDGTLTNFASGALRRGDRGVLIEGARTNLFLYSQDFSNAAWTKSNTTVTADAIAAPDGTLTADLIVPNATSGPHFITNSATVGSAAAHTITLFCKAGGYSRVGIREQTTSGTEAVYVLSGAGSVLTTTGSPVTDIVSLADGWYMLRFTMTLASASAFRIYVLDGGYTIGNLNSYAWSGDTTSGVYFWQADLQAGSFPSSPIVTTSSSATRAADVLTYTAGVSYPLSLWAEVERNALTTAVIQTTSNGASNIAQYYSTAANILVNVTATTLQADQILGATPAAGAVFKSAARVNTNSVKGAVNGTLGTEDTSVTLPTNPVLWTVGATSANTFQLFGYISRLAIFNSALSDANIETVTGS